MRPRRAARALKPRVEARRPREGSATSASAQEYEISETLYQGRCTALVRALRSSDRRPVILKLVQPRRSRERDVERLRREYEMAASLDVRAVVRPLALDTYKGMPALVFEDYGGQPLDRLLAAPMPVGRFLEIAVHVAGAVAELHEHGVVHKDLKPQNVLVHPATGEVRLADLGIATRLRREQQAPRPPELIEGSLPYMSPEQTGRMNRALDSRTDLYSLGVTFYEALTGRLPFEARDPLEWLHAHIARQPHDPSRFVREIPEALDRIVAKLLAKMPEDRYQTARGLEHDLTRCLEQWRSSGHIQPFTPGERDVSDRLHIPQKLYGREEHARTLLAAFERVVATGAPELVLISGYSGIGKSSLVHELQKPIVGRDGLFAAGKFDQYARDIPYSTIAQAFRELVLGLLVGPEDSVARWGQRLKAALGRNGQLVVDVIPQVELLVGRQPPVAELPPAETQKRFHMVFRRFVGAFTQNERPLTLFVDDLQWADPASLELLKHLVTHPEVGSLLVLGAYRHNEVTPAHPLASMLESARRAGAKVSDVLVGPMSEEDLTAFVADALHCSPRDARSLASLVREKTAGNPYFVIQFLALLERQGLIAFDRSAGAWRWDIAKIRAQGYTDNVIEMMVGKLRHLPLEAQEALKLAACIGGRVEAETLAIIGQPDFEAALRPALEENLLLQVDRTYVFPHDRVQEAAYSLIPVGQRAAMHLGIGRTLLARAAREELEEKAFEIAGQLDRAAALITSPGERERVAELDLIAGQRARRSTAHASALKYFAAGTALLPEDRWERLHALAFGLEFHQAECEYLTGALQAAEERLSVLWRRAGDLAELAALTCLRLDLYTTLDQTDRGVEVCLEYLQRVGIDWSPHPTRDEVGREYDRIWRRLGDRSIEDLVDAAPMSDPESRVTMDVLTALMPAALFTDENLLCLSIGRMANISLEHGHCEASSLVYVWLGMILGPYFGDFRTAYRFGKLGLELVERGLQRFKARVYLCFAIFVNPWVRHVRTSRELERRAFDAAIETGDLTFAAYSCANVIHNLLASGEPLGDVEREAEAGLALAREMGFGLFVDIVTAQIRYVKTLRGLTPSFSSLDAEGFDEGRFEQHLEEDPRLAIGACWYWIRKLQSRVFAGDHASAVEAASKAEQFLWTSRPFFEIAEYHYYAALALAGHHAAAPDDGQQRRELERIVSHHEQLEAWAENCPENFRGRAALVAAEIARIEGRGDDAAQRYEQAIRSARDDGFVQNEALAYELASRFYRARGYGEIADTYLRDARACYARWGAAGKVKQLERLHPPLVETSSPAATVTFAVRSEQLDFLSVVKASQTISGVIEVEELVCTLLKVVLEQGGARKGCLLLDRGGALFVEAEAAMEEKGIATRILHSAPLESSPLVPASVVHYAQLTREPVIVQDMTAAESPFASDPYFSHRPTRSVLCLPILRQAELVGVLYLENRYVAGAFTPDRLTALSLLASQAAISMENARLLREERQARQRSAFLSEAGALLSESLDYERTLARLGDLCVKSLADWCVLDLVEGGELHRLAGACSDPAKEPLLDRLRERYPARWDSPHPAAKALQDGRPLLLTEMSDEQARSHCEDQDHFELVRALGIRSIMVVPLSARGQTLGVFTIASATPGRYGPADLELAQEVARRAASAIDNARLYREVQRADQRKSEFIAVLSHELRNPLAPIRMGLELLRRCPPDGPIALKAREMMERQTEHLTHLVNDLLDTSRISHGRIELQRMRVDLREVVRSACDDLRPLFERAAVELRLEPVTQPIWIDADRNRLFQVLGNLLQNAMKFTPPQGSVTVRVATVQDHARVSVRDTGKGMTSREMGRLFQPFGQADQGLARTEGGLGLGLALVKGLVELHGGFVRARSEGPGRGSEFEFELPLAAAPGANPTPDSPAAHLVGRSILVIEDNVDMCECLSTALELDGHRVDAAHDGSTGISMVHELKPDVVLCDIGLPDMDGYEVARTLRADESLRGTRIIALTGYVGPEDKARAREAGFDAHIAKPVDPRLLSALVSSSGS